MLWAGVIAGGVGFVLSLRYRIGAVVAAGLLGLIVVICSAWAADWTVQATLATMTIMLCTLNAGYISGLALSCALSRASEKEETDPFSVGRPTRSPRPQGVGLPDFHH